MIEIIIVGITSFIGGVIMTGSIYKMVNYWIEQREIDNRVNALLIEYENINHDL